MHTTTGTVPDRKPYSHNDAITDGTSNPKPYLEHVVDYYFLTCGNSLHDATPRRHFKTAEAAERAAAKLNEEEVIASLAIPTEYRDRFDRYRELRASTGQVHQTWHGSHPLHSLPSQPGRYALRIYDDGGSYWDNHESLEEVSDAIKAYDVMQVVDLDTGEDIEYTVNVEFATP